MPNLIFSKISQDYGYESSGEQVKIELKVHRSTTPITITTYLVEGNSYTVKQIWQAVIAAWNAHSWTIPAPMLTIDYTNGIYTEFISAFEITFNSIEIFVNENNPRSLELPMILGFNNYMLESTGSVKIDWDTTHSEFPGLMPYIGTWRMPLNIDNGYGFKSAVANWSSIKAKLGTETDISKTSIKNGKFEIIRGFKIDIDNIPNKYLVQYDSFIDFSSAGEVELSFGFDLFGDNTYDAYIWASESGEETILFVQEQLMRYQITLIPSSYLEV